jgi:hypothetical protein
MNSAKPTKKATPTSNREGDKPIVGATRTAGERQLRRAEERNFFVYPVVQGRGRRLFPDGFELPRLTLLEATSFTAGIVYSRYSADRS